MFPRSRYDSSRCSVARGWCLPLLPRSSCWFRDGGPDEAQRSVVGLRREQHRGWDRHPTSSSSFSPNGTGFLLKLWVFVYLCGIAESCSPAVHGGASARGVSVSIFVHVWWCGEGMRDGAIGSLMCHVWCQSWLGTCFRHNHKVVSFSLVSTC
jgi:hypothetical protein